MVDDPGKPKVDDVKPQPRDFPNKNDKTNDIQKTAKDSDNVLNMTESTIATDEIL